MGRSKGHVELCRGVGRVHALSMLACALLTNGCGAYVSPHSAGTTQVSLRSNQDNTAFYVDGKLVAQGRTAQVNLSNHPHELAAHPYGYVAKSNPVKPPYDSSYTYQFTFLIEDRDTQVASAAAAPASVQQQLAPQPAPVATPKDTAAARIWLLAVGVSRYQERGISLRYAAADASGIAGALLSNTGQALSEDRTILLTDEKATRANILGALSTLGRRTAPNDLLIVYMALHGLPDGGGDLYYLAHDTKTSQLVGTGLPQRDVEYALQQAPAGRVLLIADACHSGSAGFSSGASRRGLRLAETHRLVQGISDARKGLVVLSAATANEASLEGPQWKHGVFTHFLMQGLSGGADADRNGLVTIREIYDFTYSSVSEATQGRQHPELKGQFDNGLPIAQPGK